MQKSLDQKLAAIHADPSGAKDFILADAKDADMALGIGAPGRSPEMHAGEVRLRTLAEYREQIRQIVRQGLVDIMLMSASTSALLTLDEGLFDQSHVTPAGRANDASDVFVVRGGKYLETPARPFRTAALDHLQCGHLDCEPNERGRGANLGLYSVTFNNNLDDDLPVLEAYQAFRLEAEQKGFRHFLEVFDPNAPRGLNADQIPPFINDHIARTLAGVAPAGRPVFLKIVYHGPRSMEELVQYDPHLIVGILGGSAGTTYDAFKMLAEAKKYGARAALYGRKINSSECQLAFVHFLRLIAEDQIGPEEAVRAYHGVLEQLKIRPYRSLADDMQLQTNVMSYARSGTAVPSLPAGVSESKAMRSAALPAAAAHDCGCGGSDPVQCECGPGSHENHPHPHKQPRAAAPAANADRSTAPPDFTAMSQAEKNAFHQANRDRVFGK
ncbi:MAG TPA: hypothetical protein VFE24_14225 [Pirellulales bacterium]|jgi:hypothetical protein|nr:hypothetical protein [Pirellulales bacterium]